MAIQVDLCQIRNKVANSPFAGIVMKHLLYLFHIWTIFGPLFPALGNDGGQLGRKRTILESGTGSLHDRVQDVESTLKIGEGLLAAPHLPANDGKGIYVASAIVPNNSARIYRVLPIHMLPPLVFLAAENLRCHKFWRANSARHLCVACFAESSRQSKIAQLGTAIMAHEDVAGFQVAVNHSAGVKKTERIQYLCGVVEEPLSRDKLLSLAQVTEHGPEGLRTHFQDKPASFVLIDGKAPKLD